MKYFCLLAAVLLVFSCAALAQAGCIPLPDNHMSLAWFTDTRGHDGTFLSLMIAPDYGEESLSEVFRSDGIQVNGEITVWVVDAIGQPLAGVLPDEVQLGSDDPRLVFCPGTNIARVATDANGNTWFDGPLSGGGTSDGYLRVSICNQFLSGAYLDLKINSPDLNGDLLVNLADVQMFAVDYYGVYDYRSDFEYDGAVNLSDITRLARHMGASCPGS